MRATSNGRSSLIYELTQNQLDIRLAQDLHPDSALFNIGGYLRIDGRIEPAVMKKALVHLVGEYDALHLRFGLRDGLPYQYFIEPDGPDIPLVDMTDQPDPAAAALQWMQEQFARPFRHFDRALFDFAVVKISEERWYWFFKYYHLINDGWGISLLTERLKVLYSALSEDAAIPPNPVISYREKIKDDKQYLESARYRQDRRYWENCFASLPPIAFPEATDSEGMRTQRHTIEIQRAHYGELQELARANGLSIFHLMLALVYVYFSRLQQQEEIVLGLPILNRSSAAFKRCGGLFTGICPLRLSLPGDASLIEFAALIKSRLRDVYRHQAFPIGHIHQIVANTHRQRHPLFNITVNFIDHNYSAPIGDSPTAVLSLSPCAQAEALSIWIRDFNDGRSVHLDLNFQTGIFSDAAMEQISTRLRQLLQIVRAQADRPVHQIDLLPPKERRRITVDYNASEQEFPPTLLPELIDRQGELRPEAIALVFQDQSLTYDSLLERANRLASHLRDSGIGPEVFVGIAVDRSLSMMVALLGVLKAGGAYLPLDPAFPVDRLAYMLEDAGVDTIITTADILPAGLTDGRRCVFLQPEDGELEDQEHAAERRAARRSERTAAADRADATIGMACPAGPENTAYIIYTSGSTGKPKGIRISHGALTNFLHAMTAKPGLTDRDTMLALTTISFDIAVLELWAPLALGARVLIGDKETAADAGRLLQLMRNSAATVMQATPSTWQMLLHAGWRQSLALRLFSAGEALPTHLADRLLRLGSEVWNLYGPTETTIHSAVQELGPQARQDLQGTSEAVGRPVANTRIFILDRHFQLVPQGAVGEVFIGGAGLATAYLNRPALTAERFVCDPFATQAGTRLYRTGDLGRRLADGRIELLGRIDHQVKIRGFRIETGEIEALLLQHPSIAQALVMVREDRPQDKQLVAYLRIAEDGPQPETDELRAFLAARVPDYMLPGFFVTLTAFPLTPNGKINRSALPAPRQTESSSSAAAYVEARTETEKQVAGIWREVLGLPKISVDDQFLHIGGHSLLAVRIVARIRTLMRIEVPPRVIFDRATIGALSNYIDRQGPGTDIASSQITRVERRDELPLSYAQQRLWFLDQLEGPSATYVIPIAFQVRGRLDLNILADCFTALCRRHEILRSNFRSVEGQAVQSIRPPEPFRIRTVEIDPSTSDADLNSAVEQEAKKTFTLSDESLLRVTAFQRSGTTSILLITMHHIIADAWSIDILLRELGLIYDALQRGEQPALADSGIQFADYSVWQRRWLTSAACAEQLRYWRRQLRDADALLAVATDRARPATQSFRGAMLRFSIDAELSQQLEALSRREAVTLFMTMQSAWLCLLGRYSGQHDIVIGSPIANRQHQDVEQLIGFFVNTLALRADLSGNPNFQELLGRVKQTALEAYANQEIPFDQVVDELGLERKLSHSPLFQVMFNWENTALTEIQLHEAKLSFVPLHNEVAKFDLTLSMGPRGDGLAASLEYNTDLFERATIERMADHLLNLLQSIVENPNQGIEDLQFLSAADIKRQTDEWNRAPRPLPDMRCVHQRFEDCARRTPEALALVMEGERWTYAELNQRSNRLAHYLRSQGIGPEQRVAILMERSPLMITAILATLKAGAAYSALDNDAPAERLSYMLADLEAPLLITQQSLMSGLPSTVCPLLCLDAAEDILAGFAATNVLNRAEAGHLAYCIFTSGSTGIPKGVMATHANLLNILDGFESLHLHSESRVSASIAAWHFDASVWEIFSMLAYGGTLHILPPEIHSRAAAYAQYIIDHQLSSILLMPALLPEFVAYLEQHPQPNNIKGVNLAFEPIAQKTIQRLRNLLPDALILNGYGPTEASICCTNLKFQSADEPERRTSVGEPMPGYTVYIVDKSLGLVPQGVNGEIVIGGLGVTRGYLKRPAITAARFVPDPFSSSPGARLYRSGDLGRYLPDGKLEFVGRADHQVKFRGFRIELGEIEAALNSLPTLRQSVVLLREDQAGQQRLAAYVVGSDAADSEALRGALRQKLPPYMIPGDIIRLDELPLLSNGKVNRKALPAPQTSVTAMTAPRTDRETQLAGIWCEVLQRRAVGVHDNFFALGGDSILSIQVVARARQVGIVLTARMLFQHQTIAELAAASAGETANQEGPDSVSGSLPLTPIQHWFFARNIQQADYFNQAALLETDEQIDADLCRQAFQGLLRYHDALRLRFTSVDGAWRQEYSDRSELEFFSTYCVAALTAREQEQRIQTIIAELHGALKLDAGPLLRTALIQRGTEAAPLLFVVAHHLVIDGVSWRILLEDFAALYRMLDKKQPPRLPAKTSSFQQWAQGLQEFAQSDTIKSEVDFWLKQRQEPFTALPVDHDAGPDANTMATSEELVLRLTEAETQALLSETATAYNTQINDLLLSALAGALAQWSAGSGVLIDLESHGREELFDVLDLTRSVGWFTALFPLYLKVNADARPGETIKAIKEQLRAVPQRGLGYGILRYLTQDKEVTAQLAALPQPQMSFNYLGQVDQVMQQGPLRGWSALGTGAPTATDTLRTHLIDVNALVAAGRLELRWTFSRVFHRSSTIRQLADQFRQRLLAIVSHCRQADHRGFTPSDFPAARLRQAELDNLLDMLDKRSGKAARDKIADIYELTPLQQGMLFHVLYDPKSSVYFEQFRCTLRGQINVPALQKAWQQVINRHSALRSSFWTGLHKPLQIVHKELLLPWTLLDWRDDSAEQQARNLEEFCRRDRETPFTLEHAPLLRCALIQGSFDRWYFVISQHHLIADGWSFPIMFKEFLQVYTGLCSGSDIRLATAAPYRSFITWLHEQDQQSAAAFWRRELEGFTSPTTLMLTKPKQVEANESGQDEWQLPLPAELTQKLEALAREQRVTLSTLFQGAWAILLGRLANERDVLFGLTVAGRPPELRDVETMVGMFINTVPVRVRIPAEQSLALWLRELQNRHAEREHFSFSSLTDIQSLSDVPAELALFETLLVFENYPLGTIASDLQAAFAIDDLQLYEQTNYPLTVIVAPGATLQLRFNYDPQRFDVAAIRHLGAMLQTLLISMTEVADRPPTALTLLSEKERQQVLYTWNDATADPSPAIDPLQLFERQVQQRPDAWAVTYGATRLRYRELQTKVNQLARYLRRSGMQPGDLLGLYVNRSIEMLQGVLAILKAGGVLVPLDPDYPPQRLKFMAEDSGLRHILTTEDLQARLPIKQAQLICIDSIKEESPHKGDEEPADTATAHSQLAYVLYTSGSTGLPKGVAMPRTAIANLIRWHIDSLQPAPGERTLQFASLNFDVAFQEIFTSLGSGGELLLIADSDRRDPYIMLDILDRSAVAHLFLPYVALQQLAAAATASQVYPPSLRSIVTAGEQLQATDTLRRLLAKIPACRLHNHYGPTESHVASAYTLAANPMDWAPLPPIGQPIANSQMYLLDDTLEPLPVGVVGELYIGGQGLAQSYLGRPGLTAERFLPRPWGADPGTRMYRTGDLARYRPDGAIEFIGRADQQCKIRGYRVEIGEVEAVLGGHPKLREALVIAWNSKAGGKRLLAYYSTLAEESIASEELQRYLAGQLPEYMIPSQFVQLDELPLTPSGKIDRSRLAAKAPQDDDSSPRRITPPRRPIEMMLAELWTTLLDVERVGIHDNFFVLGGHSLLATQLITRIHRVFNRKLPLRRLFELPTIAELATVLATDDGRSCHDEIPLITAVKRREAHPLSFAQQRLWFLDQLDGTQGAYNMPSALRISGRLDLKALEESLRHLCRRHEVLRSRFSRRDGRPVQILRSADDFALRVDDLRTMPAREREAVIKHMTQQEHEHPFDLAKEVLLRALLLHCGPEDFILLITMHHIIADGWSVAILMRELSELYDACLEKREALLPELPLQYIDYCHWQREWLQSAGMQAQADYWRAQLLDAPALLELPTDRPRPAHQTFNGRTLTFELDKELSDRLKTFSSDEGLTLFMLLHAAWAILLARYCGMQDILIGTPIANRHYEVLEPLIGFFVNTLVLRTSVKGELSLREFMTQVRDTDLAAYARQDIPFEHVVELAGPERRLSHTPLFQVMFDFQNTPVEELRLGELALEMLPITGTVAKFDLSLTMAEERGCLRGALEYNTDLFDADTIAGIAEQFQILLRGIPAAASQRIADLSLLSGDNRRQLVEHWSRAEVAAAGAENFVDLFEHRASQTPDATALIADDRRFTYGELLREVNRLARYLRDRGVGRGDLVGIAIRRSADMIVGMLGIMRAGAAYVPVDPDYPEARLAFILRDCKIRTLVTTLDAFTAPADIKQLHFVFLDRDRDRIARYSSAAPTHRPHPQDSAYVIYTSGSSGRPKGVVIPQRSLAAHCAALQAHDAVRAQDRVLQFNTINFDVSVEEIFVTLAAGACLLLLPDVRTISFAELMSFIEHHRVSVLNLPTAYWREWVSFLGLRKTSLPADLRLLILGGETLPPPTLAEWQRLYATQVRVINAYGPTETTVSVTFHDTDLSQPFTDQTSVPIGRPVAHSEVYILDDRLQPVPVGVPGEIYIGGSRLAWGYLGRPALTAASFVPHPFSKVGGARLYKTGDRARFRADGQIAFIGRRDDQLKLNGFRIEPGEVEALLKSHPAVAEAVVVVDRTEGQTARLLAYALPRKERELSLPVLEAHLHSRLPDYMRPSSIQILKEFPMSPGGKIDRKALPRPDNDIKRTSSQAREAQTELQIQLTQVWQAVLQCERPGIDDDFFDLGGNSLKIIQLHSRLAELLTLPLTIGDLFDNTTIARQAEVIERYQALQKPSDGASDAGDDKDAETVTIIEF